MVDPLSSYDTLSKHRDPASVQSERLDALREMFSARSRITARRSALYAVLGAMVVVGFGIWGFAVETNTRDMPMRPPVPQRPAGPIMVVITPSR